MLDADEASRFHNPKFIGRIVDEQLGVRPPVAGRFATRSKVPRVDTVEAA